MLNIIPKKPITVTTKQNMGSKVFLDANVILDISLQRQGFVAAGVIMEAAIKATIELYTTPAVLHVAAYYTKRHFSIEKTKQFFLSLLNDVTVIDCNHAISVLAISSSIDDIEDALQYYTALTHELDYFISSDKKLKTAALPQLPVYTAAEFVAELSAM